MMENSARYTFMASKLFWNFVSQVKCTQRFCEEYFVVSYFFPFFVGKVNKINNSAQDSMEKFSVF